MQQTPDELAFEPGETPDEAKAEIGIAEWLDPDTGELTRPIIEGSNKDSLICVKGCTALAKPRLVTDADQSRKPLLPDDEVVTQHVSKENIMSVRTPAVAPKNKTVANIALVGEPLWWPTELCVNLEELREVVD